MTAIERGLLAARPENAIAARGLRKAYPGDVQALDGLGFAVEAGTVFALLGPNGAGKSTTVKIAPRLGRGARRGDRRPA